MKTRHIRRALVIAGTVVAALLFFVGGVVLRVLWAPISLGPFSAAIEDALNEAVSGLVVRFDTAAIEWSRSEGKVNLVIMGTRVFDPANRIVAQAPKADIDFDAAALIGGRIVPRRLTLVGVQLTAERSLDGTLRLGFDAGDQNTDLFAAIREALRGSGKEPELNDFSIRDARIAFHDEYTGLFVISPRAALAIQDEQDGLHARLNADIEISGKAAKLTANMDLSDSGLPRTVAMELQGLDLSALAANSAMFSGLQPVGLTTDLTVDVALSAEGALQAVSLEATGGGTIGRRSIDPIIIPVDRFHLAGHYDGAVRQFSIGDLTITGEHSRAKTVGGFVFAGENGAWTSIAGTLETTGIFLDLPDLLSAPVGFNKFAVSAAYNRETRLLTLTRVSLFGGPVAVDAAGSVSFTGDESPAIAVTGSIAQLPVRELLHYWPRVVGTGPREWIDANMSEGLVGPARLEMNIPGSALDAGSIPDNAVMLTFPFSGVTAKYIEGMTPITGAHGSGVLSGDTFNATVEGSDIGTLALTNGTIHIPDLHLHGAPGDLRAHIEGPMSAILSLIDQDPLGYPKRFGISPSSVGGSGSIDLSFIVPMLKNVSVTQLQIGVQARARGLVLALAGGRRVEGAEASLALDGAGLTSMGTARISGIPVSFKWTENFVEADPMSTHVEFSGVVDEAGRKALGANGLEWLKGSARANVTLIGRRAHFETGTIQADLANATFHVRQINWDKAAGTAANLSANLIFEEASSLTLSGLNITGQGFSAKGDISLDKAGNIRRAKFDSVTIGRNNFTLAWETAPDGAPAIDIRGASLDASQLFQSDAASRQINPSGQTDITQPLHIRANLQNVVLRANRSLRNFLLVADFGPNERVDQLQLSADGPGATGKISGTSSAVNGHRQLTINSDDAGAFVAAFSGFNSIRGGTLAVNADFTDTSSTAQPNAGARGPIDYKGTLVLRNFVAVDQPFLARFFAIGSLDGPLRLLRGQGIAVTTLEAPFSSRGKRITVNNGRASGPAVGISFDGLIDRHADQVELGGSLVPVYGLNSVLGKLPVVGNLLVSKPGEGIIGITYQVKGDIDEPNLSVNPLSMLTPGIFRRIFEFAGPGPEKPEQETQFVKPPTVATSPVPTPPASTSPSSTQ